FFFWSFISKLFRKQFFRSFPIDLFFTSCSEYSYGVARDFPPYLWFYHRYKLHPFCCRFGFSSSSS
ncbi:hypothetical protein D0Y65_015096, partial [Glycine soja]